MNDLLTTSLYKFHQEQKAKMIEFAGWHMPFAYEGTIKEHNYVRNESGFFDVSHMGRIYIENNEIEKVNKLICSDLINLPNTKAMYSIFTNEKGNALDDVIFWKFETYIILICNAINRDKITMHLSNNEILYKDITFETSLIAIQGPQSIELLKTLLEIPDKFSTNKNKTFTYARTGYTGEDGLEIMYENIHTDQVIKFLIENNIKPCGLGSRDTLRLEASLPLYGFELTDKISPVEANLKWVINNNDNYIGKNIIDNQIETGDHKYLKKFIIESKRIPRTGTEVKSNNVSGVVTSGNYSPILEKSIGFVLLDRLPESHLLEFDIRGNLLEGQIINKRFLS